MDILNEVHAQAPDPDYEEAILNWIDSRVTEGEGILQDEPAYPEIDRCISYIMGDQIDKARSSQLSSVYDNRLKSSLNQTVAALTDIHPLFGFKTFNPEFKDQENILIKLSQAWWVNTFADLKLADVIKFAAGVGTGYCEVAWDAGLYDGTGDIVLRAIDPRDVLPINPILNGSIQDWGGVILRTSKTPEELRSRFPDKAARIKADNSPTLMARTWTRARKLLSSVVSPSAVDVANGMGRARSVSPKISTCDVYTTYFKDRRLYMGAEPKIMGDANTTWSYTVYPVDFPRVPDGNYSDGTPRFRKATLQESRLYPRGRMIVATRTCVLYDGPNPYWHGMFPVAKVSLDPWPWSLLGVGLVHDIIPLQDAFNETLNGIMDHIRKLLRPAVVADKKSVAESVWSRLDSRLPGMKLKTNPTAGKGIEFVSPEPLPAYTFEMMKFLTEEIDYQAGTPNLSALMQLQQVPGEDTIEKMQEALSPVLRLKGRLLEYFLREIGEMVKANFFQFYNLPRRIAMLGEAGVAFNDFDFDPGTLIPALSQSDPGYTFELDKMHSRSQRAQWFHKNFTFSITPNSLLAISQISRKLMYMQLRQMGLMDRWTLFDVLEVPNGGQPPNGAETISDRLAAEAALQMQMNLAMQAEAMLGAAGMGMPPPNATGQPGNPSGPGRPPTFEKPPSLQNKSDENGIPRQTISSSGGGGPNP